MKQQTAVQWLIEQTRKPEWHSLKRGEILEQAKQMEKQQIIEAFDLGDANAIHRVVQERKDTIQYGEQYFKETYTDETT